METPTVAILSAGELYGGAERQIVDLCSQYLSLGQHLKVFLFHKREVASRLEKIGIVPVILDGGHKYSTSNANDFASEIIRNNISVVHAHGYRAMVTCAIARKKADFMVVKTEHGLPEKAGSVIGRVKTEINHQLDNRATRECCDSVCYVTKDLMKNCQKQHRNINKHVIYNGITPIDARDFVRPESFNPSKNNIVIAGRVSEVKGINYAIEAMSNSLMPDNSILHIVGDGPLLEFYKESASNSDIIVFHGFRRDAMNFIAHADVLLMPSMHEGLPYTLLEAMSLETPVIVSEVGGMAEVIDNNITGILLPPKDSDEIARACKRVLNDGQLSQTLVTNAAKLQREKFTLDQMAESYLKVYSDVSR